MKQSFFLIWSRILIPAGLVMIVLSLWMLPFQEHGSAERFISFVNCGLGGLLTLIGIVLSKIERTHRDNS